MPEMFATWKKVSHQNKYQLAWIELPNGPFKVEIGKWLKQIARSKMGGGPARKERKELAAEFNHLLHVYAAVLGRLGARPDANLAQNVRTFQDAYKKQFKSDLTPPNLVGDKSIIDLLAVNAAKHDRLKAKQNLVRYWINGVDHFPPHKDGVSMKFQYFGNMEKEKTRLFLQVMLDDAAKGVDANGSTHPWLKTETDTQIGARTEVVSTYTDDEFKTIIAGNAAASYGVRKSGKCEIEITGLKAELSAEAFAGAEGSAEGKIEIRKGEGISASGKVEAMIGVRLKCDANVDVADIFLIETSAEAFAGAMAQAEAEIDVSVNGVKVNVAAEAFAGVKLKGSGAMTVKMCGYEITKGKVEAYVSVGVGGEAKFAFEATTFGGVSLELGAGATVGVGAGASGAVTVYPDNIQRVAHSLFYVGYLRLMGENQKAYTWKTYFRELEDNRILLVKANGELSKLLEAVELERVLMGSRLGAWKEMEALARFSRPELFPV